MGKNVFLGIAPAVAQVCTVTPANVNIGNQFKVTLADDAGDSYQISFTATVATVANVTAGLVAAAAAAKAAGILPWSNVTCADLSTAVTITASTAGVPFTATPSAVGGTATLTGSATTASSGPSDASIAGNWSLGAVPVAADDVYFENCSTDCVYGLATLAAVALNSLNVGLTYLGNLGAGSVPGSGYFQCLASSLNVGYYYGFGSPSGGGRVKINLGATACAITIFNSSSSPAEPALPTVRLLMNNAASVLNVRQGRVGVACETAAETSTLSAANVSYVSQQASDAQLLLGAGVTITTLTKTGGAAVLQSACTTVTNRAGTVQITGAGAVTTLNVEGGTALPQSTGTITTVNAIGGLIDFTGSTSARTVTTLAAPDGSTATIKYDPAVVTITNKLAPAGPVTIALAAA